MTAPASPSVPAKSPAMPAMHTPREYTLPGIRDAWVREKLRQMLAHIAACQPPDYDDAVEFMGAEKATKMMKAFEDDGQCCPNHAPNAR